MFCPHCGKPLDDQSRFCRSCGQPVQAGAGPQPAVPAQTAVPTAPAATTAQSARDAAMHSQPGAARGSAAPGQAGQPTAAAGGYPPAYPASYPPASYPPAYPPAGQAAGRAPKKRRTGLIVTLAILAVLAGAAAWFLGSLFAWFGPKNLGVTYTEADFDSAMAKIGTQIIYEGQTGQDLRDVTRQLKREGTLLPIADYEWRHSDYQERSFELTSAEATALLNEIAPAFWWFEDQQIKVNEDGTVEASGTGRMRKALDDLYPELVDDVPVPIFEKVNLYASGGIKITENKLSLSADTFMTGPIEGVSAQMLNENAFYFEALYTSVPGLVIHNLEITGQGTIQVDALIPQRTEVIRRVP